jgi:hypothetical protein
VASVVSPNKSLTVHSTCPTGRAHYVCLFLNTTKVIELLLHYSQLRPDDVHVTTHIGFDFVLAG